MEPANFNESNTILSRPVGGPQDVTPLYVCRTHFKDGTPVVISCWKPTLDELNEIQRTGRVWLMVLGETQAPAKVLGVSPFQASDKNPLIPGS